MYKPIIINRIWKIKIAINEAKSDVMIGHDTGCITTLDKNQWIAKADEANAGKNYELPVISDIQFAALACGADPFKIVQSHWHASPFENLFEKMGIDWEAGKANFEAYLKQYRSLSRPYRSVRNLYLFS